MPEALLLHQPAWSTASNERGRQSISSGHTGERAAVSHLTSRAVESEANSTDMGLDVGLYAIFLRQTKQEGSISQHSREVPEKLKCQHAPCTLGFLCSQPPGLSRSGRQLSSSITTAQGHRMSCLIRALSDVTLCSVFLTSQGFFS